MWWHWKKKLPALELFWTRTVFCRRERNNIQYFTESFITQHLYFWVILSQAKTKLFIASEWFISSAVLFSPSNSEKNYLKINCKIIRSAATITLSFVGWWISIRKNNLSNLSVTGVLFNINKMAGSIIKHARLIANISECPKSIMTYHGFQKFRNCSIFLMALHI
jgi:hypothetical protein